MLTVELFSVGEKMKRGGMVRPKGEEMRKFGDGTVERGVYDRKRVKTVSLLKPPSPQTHTYIPILFND